jgi:hypothetical protein
MNKVLSNDQMLALRYVLTLPEILEALIANEHEKDPLKAAEFWTKVSAEVGEACQTCLHCDLPKHQHLVKKCLFMPDSFEVKPSILPDMNQWHNSNNPNLYQPSLLKYGQQIGTVTGSGAMGGQTTAGALSGIYSSSGYATSAKLSTTDAAKIQWIDATNAILNTPE